MFSAVKKNKSATKTQGEKMGTTHMSGVLFVFSAQPVLRLSYFPLCVNCRQPTCGLFHSWQSLLCHADTVWHYDQSNPAFIFSPLVSKKKKKRRMLLSN